MKERIYSLLVGLKDVCVITSYIIMSYTFYLIIKNGGVTWSEPNLWILYTEVFFMALSWVGFLWWGLRFLRKLKWRTRL